MICREEGGEGKKRKRKKIHRDVCSLDFEGCIKMRSKRFAMACAVTV